MARIGEIFCNPDLDKNVFAKRGSRVFARECGIRQAFLQSDPPLAKQVRSAQMGVWAPHSHAEVPMTDVNSNGNNGQTPGGRAASGNRVLSRENRGGPDASKKIAHHQITLPKGGGAIAGIGEKFGTNPVTGTASFSVPVPVTPDRSGFAPKLFLSYDSGAGNSVFGLGWHIDIPNVTRKTSKALPKYDDVSESDIFLLSDAEDLVPVLDDDGNRTGRYRPRIEGLFARIEKLDGDDGVYWRAVTKENVTSIYGKHETHRIAAPGDKTKVFSWLLERTVDAKGNAILYEYRPEDLNGVPRSIFERNRRFMIPSPSFANKHIKKIHYGVKQGAAGEAEADFHFTLLFDYGEQLPDNPVPDLDEGDEPRWTARQDPFSNHTPGFDRRTYRLCRQIVLFHSFEGSPGLGPSPVPVKVLKLTHEENKTATTLTGIAIEGYKQLTAEEWEIVSLPTLNFAYSEAKIDPAVKRVDGKSLEDLPQGIGGAYQFMDFEGEGLPGIFIEQGNSWYYKRNNGDATFGPLERLSEKMSPSQLGGVPRLVDVDGDGNNELVLSGKVLHGYFSYIDGKWENFRNFANRENLNLNDPKIKQIDLTGDGRPDVLMAEDNLFTWHESLLKDGYGPAHRRFHPCDEEKGPRVVFAEAVQTVFLADMSGDGMADIVRIRNGGVCYWPNLGHGRFGAKIAMEGSPYFDSPERFNPQCLKLGDIDGSGTTDIFYFANGRLKCWLNQAGNSFRELTASERPLLMPVDSTAEVSVVDLLGKGTSCLVWATANPGRENRRISYVDLMSAGKSHLLTGINNNMGKQVNITYAPSTECYLADRKAGRPWRTKLPFPVHVIKEVETKDLIGGTVHHTQYRYHHGFFDGQEREYRGFGFVETIDTKAFAAYSNTSQEECVKPVLTKTWFHNGAFVKQGIVSKQYATEYFPDVETANPDVLPDTVIEDEASLTTEELREAYRSMKTKTLRQEVWEADPNTGAAVGVAPYTAAESNFILRRIQPKGDNKNAVFVVHPRETIHLNYEQNPTDPRIAHEFTLEVDDYGNIRKTVSAVYPRNPGVAAIAPEQEIPYAVYAENAFNNPEAGDFYLAGVPTETKQFELGNIRPAAGEGYIRFESFFDRENDSGTTIEGLLTKAFADVIGFEQEMAPRRDRYQARQIAWQRYLYWNDAQTGPLPPGAVTDKTLLHHVETAVFTPGLIEKAYGTDIATADLETAGYFFVEADRHWWNPGLKQIYSNGNFYLPIRTEDPWEKGVNVGWDLYWMSPVKTEDALGNTSVADIDYRTMRPWRLTDLNNNIAEAVTDGLGMVIAAAMYGQVDGVIKGDDPLDTYVVQTNPTRDDVLTNAETYLQNATAFFFYDLEAWTERGEPLQAVGLARETHVSDENGTKSRIQKTIAYTDGFGRELQSKLLVEDGPAWEKTGDNFFWNNGSITRWLASGRTVYNNKEKPVKQYEPFYTASAEYEPEEFFATYGMTPIIHYDSLLRVIQTDIPYKRMPDGTTVHVHTKVEFTPWQTTTYDANDTIQESEYSNIYDDLTPDEKAAFDKAAAHANTPQIADLDTMGRQFLTTAILSDTCCLETHTTVDITGKPLTITDPRQRVLNVDRQNSGEPLVETVRYTYDMTGRTLRTVSIDAGDDRLLANIMGNPAVRLDAGGHRITTTYDVLHRPLTKHVQGGETPLNHIVEVMIYGETHPHALCLNMRGKLWKTYDSSGRTAVLIYDFKGQPLITDKQLRTDYKAEANWSGDAGAWNTLLESEIFITSFMYDALGRVVLQTNPDGSVSRPIYHPSGKLNQLYVYLKDDLDETRFVNGITYNAKGQRQSIAYSNNDARPIVTTYEYDDATFRLKTLTTTRVDTRGNTKNAQAIAYVYDPVGNVVKITDNAYDRIFTTTGPVAPVQTYTYDALYRLIEATGREHNALTNTPFFNDGNQFKQSRHAQLNDLTQLANYTRHYTYDGAGNLEKIRHLGVHPFSRNIDVDMGTNRALLHPDMGTSDFEAGFDANGNQISIDHLAGIEWSYRDSIAKAVILDRSPSGDPDDVEYYVYDASGQRTRKVKETWSSQGGTKLEEKIYLGNVEIKRRRDEGSLTDIENRYTHHVMGDKERIAVVHNWETHAYTNEYAPTIGENHIRCQFANHLGSASLELTSDGDIISYEEYYPYGGTSFISGRNQTETGLKEYRFIAKERDDTTGFYYHGARYFAPWMGRWMSADPAGPAAGMNLYVYVADNPVRKTDPKGMAEDEIQTVHTVDISGRQPAAQQSEQQVQNRLQKKLPAVPSEVSALTPEVMPGSEKIKEGIETANEPVEYIGCGMEQTSEAPAAEDDGKATEMGAMTALGVAGGLLAIAFFVGLSLIPGAMRDGAAPESPLSGGSGNVPPADPAPAPATQNTAPETPVPTAFTPVDVEPSPAGESIGTPGAVDGSVGGERVDAVENDRAGFIKKFHKKVPLVRPIPRR